MDVGFTMHIQHSAWLTNIVPARKKNRQIHYCIHFRNLNKACPKDELQLSNIEMLLDATAGHFMFTFMDGFSGHNQIKIDPLDPEKIAFRIFTNNFHYTSHVVRPQKP